MSESKKAYQTIDEFILDFPKEVQEILQKIRGIVHDLAPEGEEAIAYGIPTFRLKKKNLVHFGAFKNHIGFYPTPTGMDAFKEQLSKYESGKGSAKFPLNQPIPYDLIKEIVQFRITEVLKNVKTKKVKSS
jgi:uncharacterized protein YdhG (YjbR/CyaY superfamily)